MPVTVVVGSQWGDEGKGKIVDLLSSESEIVARYQGGPNAGHTVVFDNRQFILHQIPSGILHPDTQCIIGSGAVIDPVVLQDEINMLVSDDELAQRRQAWQPPELIHQTPWQEIYRDTVGQLATGACLELAVKYRDVRKNIPRHSH